MSESNKAATIKVTHVYAVQGKSHFGELELETKVQEFAPPAPPNNLSEWMPAEQCRFISQPAGWIGEWHPAPARLLFLVLGGEAGIEVSTGERRQFTVGAHFLVEDYPGQGHRSWVVGDANLLMAIVQLKENVPLK